MEIPAREVIHREHQVALHSFCSCSKLFFIVDLLSPPAFFSIWSHSFLALLFHFVSTRRSYWLGFILDVNDFQLETDRCLSVYPPWGSGFSAGAGCWIAVFRVREPSMNKLDCSLSCVATYDGGCPYMSLPQQSHYKLTVLLTKSCCLTWSLIVA